MYVATLDMQVLYFVTSQKGYPSRYIYSEKELKYLSFCTKRHKDNRSFAQNTQSGKKEKAGIHQAGEAKPKKLNFTATQKKKKHRIYQMSDAQYL